MTFHELRQLVSTAFLIAWRNRFLWLFGLFVELSLGSLAPRGHGVPSVQNAFSQALGFLHISYTPANAVLFLLLVVALLVAAAVAGGGLMHSSVEIERGYFVRPSQAVRAGWRVAWKLIGLGIILVVMAFLTAMCAGLLIRAVSPSQVGRTLQLSGVDSPGFAISVSIPFIVFTVLLSIVGRLARRHIVVKRMGVFAALWHGLRLIIFRPGAALALWAADVACALVFLALLLVFLSPFLIPVLVFQSQSSSSAFGSAALAGMVAAVVVAVSAKGAFSSTLWTLGFLRLTR